MGWAVGAAGVVLHTSNGGLIWQQQAAGTSEYFRSVCFTDDQTGWAVGGSGLILHTSNGGVTWQQQTSGTSKYLVSVYFTDRQVGWAVGAIILKTTNGGITWHEQTTETSLQLQSVYFMDDQTGWVAGSGGASGVLKTSDGGASWQPQGLAPASGLLNDLCFVDGHVGWAVGHNGTIIKYEAVSSPTAAFNWTNQGASVQFSNTSTDASSFYWDFGDGQSSEQENPQHRYAASGNYTATLSVSNACGGVSKHEQTISIASGVSAPPFLEGFEIYPNPVGDHFTIHLKGEPQQAIQLGLFSSTGQRLYQESMNFQSGSVFKEISCRDLPSGMYWVRVSNAKGSGFRKIMIE